MATQLVEDQELLTESRAHSYRRASLRHKVDFLSVWHGDKLGGKGLPLDREPLTLAYLMAVLYLEDLSVERDFLPK